MKLISFGYKHGVPAGTIVDVRNFQNPHFVPRLRTSTGIGLEVQRWLESKPEHKRLYRELKGEVHGMKLIGVDVVYIGCTGGRHRSVALAEMLAKELGLVVEHSELRVTNDYRSDVQKATDDFNDFSSGKAGIP